MTPTAVPRRSAWGTDRQTPTRPPGDRGPSWFPGRSPAAGDGSGDARSDNRWSRFNTGRRPAYQGERNMRGMNRGLRRAAVLMVLVGAGVLVIGAQAASAQVIEICKSSSNGMSGRDFNYTVAPSGGSSFSVGPIKGGRCSGPITVSGATAVITEAQSDPATDVKYVTVRPSLRK